MPDAAERYKPSQISPSQIARNLRGWPQRRLLGSLPHPGAAMPAFGAEQVKNVRLLPCFSAENRERTALQVPIDIANLLDLCAISLPCPRAGGLPVGLMLMARNGRDRKLLRIAAAVERILAA